MDMKLNNMMKIVFDFIMLVLLVMVYSVSATGTVFHEISGLIIYIFFIIHLLYNHNWINNIKNHLFDKTLSTKTKFMYIIDFLLLITFITAGISGIVISKYLFKIGITYIWRYVHIVSSAIAVLLLGIHIGLHIKMINTIIKNKIKIYKKVYIVLFAVIFGIGIYGIIISTENGNNKEKKYNNSKTF